MDVVGYSDPLSVAFGDTVRVMVSCAASEYDADVVRLIHGDRNPAGPGLRVEPIATSSDGRYAGVHQSIAPGSYVQVADSPLLSTLQSFTVQAWIQPTTPQPGLQGLVTKWSGDGGGGLALVIAAGGELALWVGDEAGGVARLGTGMPLSPRTWTFAVGTYDAPTQRLGIHQLPMQGATGVHVYSSASIREHSGAPGVPLFLGALAAGTAAGAHFNGKLEAPAIAARALTEPEVRFSSEGSFPGDWRDIVVAEWDLAVGIATADVHDVSGHELHGSAVNLPTRAVTGRRWTGAECDFRHAPDEYAAIHFHDDDLDDAGWEVAFELDTAELPGSGAYAARLQTDTFEDFVPFFVTVRPGATGHPIAVVLPTFCYLAYANEHIARAESRTQDGNVDLARYLDGATEYERALYTYIWSNRLLSTYETHSDGSGVVYSSSRRPLANLRPLCNQPTTRFEIPHNLNADLCLLDWLEQQGFDYDLLTDHALHEGGADCLAPYAAVLTGTHPEYVSETMLSGLETYLHSGGRLMYLGGNGFYWVTSVDPHRPHSIEVRRGHTGTRTWSSAPGEQQHASTGEPGGLWKLRGRPPQRLVGVGFTALGWGHAEGYRRTADSDGPSVSFIFEGIGRDEVIGDFGLHLGGAAGWEIDRLDYDLGTPSNALKLASSFGHSDAYQHCVEEILETTAAEGGTVNPLVRADLAYTPYPNGGACFAVGSMCWCGSLSANGYDNNVSTITRNVLTNFVGQ
jgi:N,N-dimethylformamidase